MKAYYWLFVFFFVLSCSSKEEVKVEEKPEKTKFEMYEVSEMTALMELFYSNNQILKDKILNDEWDLGSLPDTYSTIYEAELTDPTDRDEFLHEHSDLFLEAQKMVYESTKENAKGRFNTMVDACITCHKVKCSGPIERIRKLYID